MRYDAVNAMLLNEFLKAHRKLDEQGRTIARQEKEIRALASQLQNVSRKIELTQPVPPLVANH